MNTRHFRSSLRDGLNGEEILAALLAKADVLVTSNKTDEFDLKCSMPDAEFTIEVKTDLMEAATHNIAVEFYNTKQCKPSGITATKANLWCVVLQRPETVWLANTRILYEFVDRTKPIRTVFDGGNNNAALKLYSRDVIMPAVFVQVDCLSPSAFINVVKELLTCTISK